MNNGKIRPLQNNHKPLMLKVKKVYDQNQSSGLDSIIKMSPSPIPSDINEQSSIGETCVDPQRYVNLKHKRVSFDKYGKKVQKNKSSMSQPPHLLIKGSVQSATPSMENLASKMNLPTVNQKLQRVALASQELIGAAGGRGFQQLPKTPNIRIQTGSALQNQQRMSRIMPQLDKNESAPLPLVVPHKSKKKVTYSGSQQDFQNNNTKENYKRNFNVSSRPMSPVDTATLVQNSQGNSSDRETRPLWNSTYDSNQAYNIQKSFTMSKARTENMREIKRWRDNDIKGNRLSYYTKEVMIKNSNVMTIVQQTRLEMAHNRTDGHKCLNMRKKMEKFRIHVSDAALALTSDKKFEGFIILVIALNCVTLAQSDSTKEETPVEKNIDLVFNIIYTVEMFLRIFSDGFIFGPGAYLKSYWCQLDFICVTTAYLEIIGGGGTSLAGLRAFRVLRPLRFVNNIEGLRIVVMSVIAAIPRLKDTIIVLFFFFLIFAIGGLNLFMGQLKQRCVHEMTGNVLVVDEDEVICGYDVCPPDYYCGKRTLNPNSDVTNFDNIFWSLLNVFQCITLEGWSEIMVMYQKAYTPWVIFFFVPMVFIGAFFLLNLTLAVIQSSYSETQAQIKADKERLRSEQAEMTMAAQKKNQTDDNQGGDASNEKKAVLSGNNIGVASFFIAKRAARKLREFSKQYREQKEIEDEMEVDRAKEEKRQKKEADRDESRQRLNVSALRRQNSIKRSKVQPSNSPKSSGPQSALLAKDKAKEDDALSGAASKVSDGGASGSHKNGETGAGFKDFTVGDRDNTQELEEMVLKSMIEDENKNINKTITEEQDSVIDDNYSDQVIKFLEQVKDPNEEPIDFEQSRPQLLSKLSQGDVVFAHQSQGNIAATSQILNIDDQDQSILNRSNTKSRMGRTLGGFDPVMAFSDIRISGPARPPKLMNKTFEQFNRPKNEPQKNNFTAMQQKDEDLVGVPEHMQRFEELDFDKVIAARQKTIEGSQDPMTQLDVDEKNGGAISGLRKAGKGDGGFGEESYEVEHPLDLSFTRDLNHGKKAMAFYDSDGDQTPKKSRNQEKLDLDVSKSSILSSDLSIVNKINEMQQTQDKFGLGRGSMVELTRQEKHDSKVRISKEVNLKMRRMLTSDFKNRDRTMNDTQSTFLGNNPSYRQQIDILSNLMPKESDSHSVKKRNHRAYSSIDAKERQKIIDTLESGTPGNFKSRKESLASDSRPNTNGTLGTLVSKQTKNKKEKLNVYHQIDREHFSVDKPNNPLTFIDKSKQKIMINPGVPYVSTSQNEIFERRILLNQKEYLNKINPYIAAPKDETAENKYEGQEEETYIKGHFQAYQLKTIWQVKQVDEIEWDSDDEEDALILAQQPYETVMQTGFTDYLNHLDTKFIARRSDIIVSSTLSITLTPIDDGFIPARFAKINSQQIEDYVNLRQEYRSHLVNSNILPKNARIGNSVVVNSQEDDSSMIPSQPINSESQVGSFFEEEQQIGMQDANTFNTIALPDTLLSQPLPANQVMRLKNKKEKRMYNVQKSKFEQVTKMNSKKKVHPRDQLFQIEDARLLIKGLYHKDEDDEEATMQIRLDNDQNNHLNLNRAMVVGKNDPKTECGLDTFDQAVVSALLDSDKGASFIDPRLQGDHVPDDMKKALGLPKNMGEYEIDFDEVRLNDARLKRRTPTWSGQEVLDVGLNTDKSKWVLKKMNKLRVWPKGLYKTIKKARCLLKAFIRLSIFDNFLTLCVLINTIVMAMNAYDIEPQTKADLEFLNGIFTWIFIVEMGIRLLARGPKKYAAEPMNLLDGGVVILSIVEIIMGALDTGSGAGSLQAFRTVRVFRTFRVLRVTRILRALKSMAMVIGVIQRSFMDFILITILMFVFIFIYTLLGRQIFQGNYDFGPDYDLPRANYDSFTVAFVTVFQVLTMENWQQVLYASMRASQGNTAMKAITAIYYISWIFIGNFILLNLFLAILIDAFAEEDAELEQTTEDIKAEEIALLARNKRLKEEKDKRMKKLGTSATKLKAMQTVQIDGDKRRQKRNEQKNRANFTGQKRLRESDLADIEDMETEEIRMMLVENDILKARKTDNIDRSEVGEDIKADNSIYLFHRNSCFRRNVHFVQKHSYFENFIMLLIALSSTKLAMESYLVDEPEDSNLVKLSEDLDFIFNYLFIMEFVLKVIALGFAMDEGSYLRDSWNRLDFFIVSTSIIDMLLSNTDIPALKILRMLRMIRPLRVISHNPQLKMIVAALFESVGSIVNVSVIVMIIWMMFAIYGMNTYMGFFFYCSEDMYKNNTKWVCEDQGGDWIRFDSNFDDIGQSMMTLFIVASLEGWPDIMYQAIDITKKDNGPKYEESPAQVAFFIIFILIGAFFFLNFFIGVLFLKYEQAQKKEESGFTKQQLYWLELQRLIIEAETPHNLRYKPVTRGIQYKTWEFVESPVFEVAIMICIVLNMFQMAIDHEGSSPNMIKFLQISNYVFTTIFLVETVIKLYVYRMPYFKTGWNKFDFFVVFSSLIDVALEWALPVPDGGQEDASSEILSVGPQLARVLRVLRVSRVLRLAKADKKLQSLLKTIMMSVDSLFNVFILLMLIFFIMAVLSNTMFYGVYEGNVIDDYKNFTNFHMSFSLLFSISTGEDWNRIMYDCMHTGPDCVEGVNCGSDIAPIFFITFIMIVSNIMLNLFILVIIQQFSKYYLEGDNPLERFEEDFDDFKEAWKDLTDRYQCVKIKPKSLHEFFKKLPGRMRQKMGVSDSAKNEEINRTILKMGINVNDGFIFFNEMLYRVMRAQFVTAINLKFNKVMTVSELVTQFRIAEITLLQNSHSKLSKRDKEDAFFSTIQSMPVNLFLTQMFFKTSFMSWRNFMRKQVKKQKWEKEVAENKAFCVRFGKPWTQPVFIEPKQVFEWIRIEKEIHIEIDLDEGEDSDSNLNDNKSRKSGNTNKLFSNHSKFQIDSPENFRLKARMRMANNSQKFSTSPSPDQKFGLNLTPSPNKSNTRMIDRKLLLVNSIDNEDQEALDDTIKNAQNRTKFDIDFVDPNSDAYQNIVLEDKINKHERQKREIEKSDMSLSKFGISLRQTKQPDKAYKGEFSNSKMSEVSPNRINSPMKSVILYPKEGHED